MAFEYEHDDGQVYMCGCLPPKHRGTLAAYAATQPVYTLAQIREFIAAGKGSLAHYCYAILNQGSMPYCWDYAATQALMVLYHMTCQEKVLLDTSCGPIVTGVYSGNSIDAMLREVQIAYGQPTAEFCGSDPTQAKIVGRLPAGWKEDAAKRKVVPRGWSEAQDPLHLASGIINGNPGSFGIFWDGSPRSGHALCVLEVGWEHNQLYFAGPNSWGERFASGYGSYPGRPGWFKKPQDQCGPAFNGTFGLGCYLLGSASNLAAPFPTFS